MIFIIDEKNKELIEKIKQNNNININIDNNRDDNIDNKLKMEKEELEGLKTFTNTLQKENISMKNQLESLSTNMTKELNALKIQLDEEKKKNQLLIGNNINNINTYRNKKN